MSSPSRGPSAEVARLVVVCGVDAGTSACADRFVGAASSDGLRVVLVSASAVDPTSLTADDPWIVQQAAAADAAVSPQTPQIALQPSARFAAVLAAVRTVLAGADADLVVLDAGDERTARDLLAHGAVVPRLIDRDLAAHVLRRADATSPEDLDRIRRARTQAQADLDLLVGHGALWRIVAPPAAASVRRVCGTVAALVVLGARIDGVVLEGYPDKGERPSVRAAARAARRSLGEQVPVVVRRSGRGQMTVPAGRAVRDAFGPVARLRCGPPTSDAGSWQWRIDLPDLVAGRVRPGIQGDRLVLEADGSFRWVDLPSVLRRTNAREAVRTPGGLRIEFLPDVRQWPATGPGEGADDGG